MTVINLKKAIFMNGILKFEREFLEDKPIHIHTRQGDTNFVLHRHDYYEMIFYKNCRGFCLLNGAQYPIEGNCAFFLTPNDYHAIKTENDEKSSSVVVSVSETMLDEEIIKALGFTARVKYTLSTEDETMLNRLCSVYFNGEKHKSLYLSHLVNLIALGFLSDGEPTQKRTQYQHYAVGKAVEKVLLDLSAKNSLVEIAKDVSLAPSYFSAVFKKETGVTFTEWLAKARIERAKRLLEKNDLSVLEICFDCGYSTPSQFIKVFKRMTGFTPSAYRKNNL